MLHHRVSGGFVFTLAVGVMGLANTNCSPKSTSEVVTAPSNLTYSANPATYTKGVAISPNTPTSSGGAVASYSVAPALPAGLALDPNSGSISGTPTAVTAQASYVVTATNAGGNTTASVSITVNDVAPTNLVYSVNPATFTKGVAITKDTPSNSGGAVVSYSVAPALPAGLNLDQGTGIISGTPTAIAATGSYVVMASNTGGTAMASVSITVNDAAPTNLTYSANPATYTKGVAITPNTPTNGGGAVVSYAVAPALPAGLSLDMGTGIISGTPTAITATGSYVVTASNSGGQARASVSITVNDLAPTNLTYSTNPAIYTKGMAITPNMPSNTGGAVVSYGVAPALPAGLSLSTTTGIISGTPTAITATASYVVTATNAAGSTTDSVSITVNDAAPTGLTYSANPAAYTKGVAITPNTPSSSGGAVLSYSVTPALPAGLSLSTTTGIISGTPTAVTATGSYVVTATNSGGHAMASVSITVNDVAPSNLTYSANPAKYTKGVAITPNTPTSSGGAVVSYGVAPALPAGLSLSTTTGIISGTPTAVTAQANYVVTATNSGGTATASVTITVNDAAPTGLTYSVNPAIYTKGVAITPNTPTSSGGAVVSYGVTPALPAGLSLSTTTGIISGTPTAITAPASYLVTATNTGGTATASVTITVNDAAPTNLTYSANPASYTKGVAITPNTPTSGGGAVVSYGVTPALPAGLSLSTTTGIISGTPTTAAATASYVVTATNTGGSTTDSVSITVKDAPPTGLTYSTNPAVYTVGTAIPQNTPTSGGGAVVSYSVSPALPAGLSLSTTTGIISGTPTAVTTKSNFTVTATNSGGSTTDVVSITVNVVSPTRFAFVANETDNTLSAYTVEANTGKLRANGYVATGTSPRTVAVHPSGLFTYVANIGAGTVSQFAINATTGQLTTIAAAIAAGARPFSVAVDPKGRFAYVANYDSSDISGYTINASTGALTSVGPTVPAGTNPSSVVVDPTGRFAYAANQTAGGVSAFAINQTTGVLTSIGAVAAGTLPYSVTVDPTGSFVYVTNETSNDVSAYTINASTGALTSVGATVPAGTSPVSVAVTPSGKFAYVASTNSSGISGFSINASTGALTSLGAATAALNPVSVTVDPSGDYLYVSNFFQNDVQTFTINASTGALTPVQTMGARPGATSFALAQGTAPVAYVPLFAYVANGGGDTVSAYTINATTGVLTHVGTDVATGQGPAAVAVDPSGRFAYVANQTDGTVSTYTINTSTGALTQVGTAQAAGTGSISVTVDPSDSFVYVANNASGDVAAFTINSTTGALTSVGANVASGSAPFSIVVDPTGRFAYVANQSGNSVAAFSINSSTGALTIIGTSNVAAGNSPVAVAADPTGSFVYVANEDDNDIQTFSIDFTTGALTSIGSTVMAGTAPHAIGIDFVGNFLYVANVTTNNVSMFSIASTGALTSIGTAVAAGVSPRSCAVDPSGSFVYAGNSDSTADSVSSYSINASTGALTAIGTPVAAGANPNWIAISGAIH